jgi:hypothetical protein
VGGVSDADPGIADRVASPSHRFRNRNSKPRGHIPMYPNNLRLPPPKLTTKCEVAKDFCRNWATTCAKVTLVRGKDCRSVGREIRSGVPLQVSSLRGKSCDGPETTSRVLGSEISSHSGLRVGRVLSANGGHRLGA